MTSVVGKWKSILYRLNLCALAMKGVVNDNSDLDFKMAVNLITHCLLINLGELEEIVNSETFEIDSVPQMSRKLFSLHNQLGNFMKTDFPEKAQEENDMDVVIQFLKEAFYEIYEDLDLSSAIKVNSLSFDQSSPASLQQSISRLNSQAPIDRFSTERQATRDSAFDSFKKPNENLDSPANLSKGQFGSMPKKTKVRSNSLFPDYDGTPTAKGPNKISFKKKKTGLGGDKVMTFGKNQRGGNSTPPRFRDTPARINKLSGEKIVNSDSELEEMAENVAKFKNFKRKTLDSGGFLEVIKNSGIRNPKTPQKE